MRENRQCTWWVSFIINSVYVFVLMWREKKNHATFPPEKCELTDESWILHKNIHTQVLTQALAYAFLIKEISCVLEMFLLSYT